MKIVTDTVSETLATALKERGSGGWALTAAVADVARDVIAGA